MEGKRIGCYDCSKPYGEDGWIEAVIPDHVWIRISPTGNIGGILCISCISKRLKDAGIWGVPVWLCGTEPLIAIAGDPSDSLELLRNYKAD